MGAVWLLWVLCGCGWVLFECLDGCCGCGWVLDGCWMGALMGAVGALMGTVGLWGAIGAMGAGWVLGVGDRDCWP